MGGFNFAAGGNRWSEKNSRVLRLIYRARRMESTNEFDKKIKEEEDQICQLWVEATYRYLLHSVHSK